MLIKILRRPFVFFLANCLPFFGTVNVAHSTDHTSLCTIAFTVSPDSSLAFKESERKQIEKTLHGFMRWWGIDASIPISVRKGVANSDDRTSYSIKENAIILMDTTPPACNDNPTNATHPAIVIHEYFHGVFRRELHARASNKFGSSYLLSYIRLNEISQIIKDLGHKIQWEKLGHYKVTLDEKNLFTSLSAEAEKIHAEFNKFRDIHNFDLLDLLKGTGAAPYDELLADAAAVFYLSDLNAMANALTTSEARARKRSFLNLFSPSGWRETLPHTLFTPTRSFIGAELISKGFAGPKELRLLLDAVFDELFQDRTMYDWRRNPEQMNRDLIAKIRLAFG